MNDDRYPMNEGNREPVVRHRRSDRHRAAGESAASPREDLSAAEAPVQEEAPRQWVRQQPPVIAPAPEEKYQRPEPKQVISTRNQQYPRQPQPEWNGSDEYEDDEESGGFPWLKAAFAAVAVLALLLAAAYFIPNNPVGNKLRSLIGAKKDAGQVLSFQATANSGVTDSRLGFHVTTNIAVDGVRLEDENGAEVVCECAMVSGEKDTNRIWSVSAVFDEPFSGNLFVAIREGEKWTRTNFSVPVNIVAPTPVPTAAPTAAPTEEPTEAPTQAPISLPTQAPEEEQPTAQETAAPEEQPAAQETAEPEELPADDEEKDDWTEPEWDDEDWSTEDAADEEPVSDPDADQSADPGKETPEAEEKAAVAMVTWAPVYVQPEATREPAATLVPTEAPTPQPTAEPAAEPTEAPTAAPTKAAPVATDLPRLEAAPSSQSLKVTDTVYNEKAKQVKKFARERSYIAPNPDQYTRFDNGIFTFRGDNFRRNAAYGTAEVSKEKLSVIWDSAIGSLRTKDNGTLHGVGWTGQPAIVKWTKEVRQMMNLNDAKKETTGLREVIFGAQDGKVYFLDLTDGKPTRDPITVGFPLKGSVSVDTLSRPLISVGQALSRLSSKSGDLGMHVFYLTDGKKAFFINGVKSNSVPAYSANGAFDGTSLFLFDNDAMVVAGENGLLYTIDLNSDFSYPYPDAETGETKKGSLTVNRSTTMLSSKGANEDKKLVNMEASVAMYNQYAYVADTYGMVRCVDTDTMQTVWAFDNGDNTDVLALDMEGSTGVSLYTGNTAYNRLGKKKDVSIRKLNALTGQEIWHYDISCTYDKEQLSGCKASPVIGQNRIKNLVIYTVNKVNGGGSKILALDKETGKVVWQKSLSAEAISSPVAVYNKRGDAWIIQGDAGGNLTMLKGSTGEVCTTLNLGGEIQGSPAVYKDILVVGTCSKDNHMMYGIRIH